MVLVRKRYFRTHCQALLERAEIRRWSAARTMAPIAHLRQREIRTEEVGAPVHVGFLRTAIEPRSESPEAMSHISAPAQVPKRSTIRARTMGRQYTVVPRKTLPMPDRERYKGLGGFSTLSVLSKMLTRVLPSRQDGGTTLLRRESIVSEDGSFVQRVADWLPPGLENLVIGRNGRFYSEELEDEELEQIGGVEYRALRFLSYFVPIVSVDAAKGVLISSLCFSAR